MQALVYHRAQFVGHSLWYPSSDVARLDVCELTATRNRTPRRCVTLRDASSTRTLHHILSFSLRSLSHISPLWHVLHHNYDTSYHILHIASHDITPYHTSYHILHIASHDVTPNHTSYHILHIASHPVAHHHTPKDGSGRVEQSDKIVQGCNVQQNGKRNKVAKRKKKLHKGVR